VALHQPLGETGDGAHPGPGLVAGHRVRAERHPGGAGGHHPLDEDRHPDLAVEFPCGAIRPDTVSPDGGDAGPDGLPERLDAADVEHGLVLARMGRVGQVLAQPRRADRDRPRDPGDHLVQDRRLEVGVVGQPLSGVPHDHDAVGDREAGAAESGQRGRLPTAPRGIVGVVESP